MRHLLPKELPNFADASILVIGDVMLDRYWFGDTTRVSPEAPVPIVNINNTDHRPGGAGNVALNIASIGANVTLLGLTGTDDDAGILAQQLNAASVHHDLCAIEKMKTIVKLRVISRHQQLIRLDFEEKNVIDAAPLLLERFKKHLSHTGLIILSDYKKGCLTQPQAFIQLAREANIPVMVDPKGNDFSIYQYANIITPNFKEFESIVGECRTEQDILEKGRALLEKHHIDTLLVTRGEDGMTIINHHDIIHLPAYAREVFDVTGAGDTVIGILGAALAAKLNFPHAAALANLAASLTVNKLGAACVSVPELQAVLTGRTNFSTGIVNDEQLLQSVKQARAQAKKIVFTNGCFDIIHAGHVRSLQMAKELGDFLIVAVNTDDSIRKLKGENRPINHLDHRMTVLAGLGVVDWVIPFTDETPERLLKMLQPDFLVKGGDYRLDQVVGADIVRAYGGQVRIVNHDITTSSTTIFNQLQEKGTV
jgi:D-beta-D-heptose 7-phosphate kinase / D-beta-D-heptose 1-phosphate adenosyltransferase